MMNEDSKGPARWPYLVSAIPVLLVGLLGHGHSGTWWLVIPLLWCLALFVSPTRSLWAPLFGAYLAVTGAYFFLLLVDVLQVSGGARGHFLVDADDSLFFVTLLVFLAATTVLLYRFRPPATDEIVRNPFSDPPENSEGTGDAA